jgi:hypothetical protein
LIVFCIDDHSLDITCSAVLGQIKGQNSRNTSSLEVISSMVTAEAVDNIVDRASQCSRGAGNTIGNNFLQDT